MSDTFDWVTVRARCTAEHVFSNLFEEVAADVEKRTKLLTDPQRHDHTDFLLERKSPDRFDVVRNGAGIFTKVIFKCSQSSIAVADAEGNMVFEATLSMNDAGECRLMVGEQQLSNWQFRKRALHDLFFVFKRTPPITY